MTLKLALLLGRDSGHKTVGETLASISTHSEMLFEYETLRKNYQN